MKATESDIWLSRGHPADGETFFSVVSVAGGQRSATQQGVLEQRLAQRQLQLQPDYLAQNVSESQILL